MRIDKIRAFTSSKVRCVFCIGQRLQYGKCSIKGSRNGSFPVSDTFPVLEALSQYELLYII